MTLKSAIMLYLITSVMGKSEYMRFYHKSY